MTNQFVHFRVQSSYSMLESMLKIEQLVALAEKNQMSSICLADRGNLFASLEFAMAAAKKNIQPIHGVILNIEYEHISAREESQLAFAEILLIAKDEVGYRNLLKLVSLTFTQNKREQCEHIKMTDLEKYQEGIIVLSAYQDGIFGKLLLEMLRASKKRQGLIMQAANKYINQLQNLFGDRFYFEIGRTSPKSERSEQQKEPTILEGLELAYLKLAKKYKIPLIATNQTLYSSRLADRAYNILVDIAERSSFRLIKTMAPPKRASDAAYFKSAEEMSELFKDIPEAIENSIYLAQRCSVMAQSRPPSLPKFTDGSISEEELIKKEAKIGLQARLAKKFALEAISQEEQASLNKIYLERLNYELSVICKMGFSGYFLIVSDFIKWSKENDIIVGPGRGSGAGSIIAWSLQITDLDPIEFGLLFERFLNPERVSMPDFDIDFCQERREEVISYVRNKYGDDRVGQIITFGTMQAKAVIKDVARASGLRYAIADYLTELIPFNAINPVTLSQAIEQVAELKYAAEGNGLYNNIFGDNKEQSKLIKEVIEISLQLEGIQRHVSTHAAGIVISNQPMTDILAIYKDTDADMNVVQYSMKYAEYSGLVKFDFLGLQTLTLLSKTIKLIKQEGRELELNNIPYDDAKTYQIFAQGISTGIFQFESGGMKSALRKLGPDNINDIIALGALYRPGPMDNIPTYIACKYGQQKVDYLHPLLENTLKPTYGVIIYQEQVMEIARMLAGYSLAEADLLRRAMGKKVKAEMDAQEQIFVDGAIANGVAEEQARSIFATVAKFAGYGFNKSHASAYGVISYQTAYLKAHFPVEFLVACLNLDIDNSDKIAIFIQEAKFFNIEIIAPSVNQSSGKFIIKNNDGKKSIIFALGAIKNVTSQIGDIIYAEREKNGNFTSVFDFLERIEPKFLNRRSLKNLIKAGCFDQICFSRASLSNKFAKLVTYSGSFHKEKSSRQFSLVSVNSHSVDVLEKLPEYSNYILAYQEFTAIGLFLDKHPFAEMHEFFSKHLVKNSTYLDQMNPGSQKCRLAGIITRKDSRMSSRGRFVTLTLADASNMFEATIYDEEVLNRSASLTYIKNPVILDCEINCDKGGLRIIVLAISSITELLERNKYETRLYLNKAANIKSLLALLQAKLNKAEKGKQEENNLLVKSAEEFNIEEDLPYIIAAKTSLTLYLPIEYAFKAKIILKSPGRNIEFALEEADLQKLGQYGRLISTEIN